VPLNEGTPRILLIEHDTWLRAQVMGQLVRAGYAVRPASNGFSGLRLARNAVPDVIVLGADLPDISAAEVRALLAANPSTQQVPVIPLPREARHGADSVNVRVRVVGAQAP
jgi:DNA-binding response OmpR family regulator